MTKSSYILLREYMDPCQGGWDLSLEKQKAVAQISFGYCAGRLTALKTLGLVLAFSGMFNLGHLKTFVIR